MLSIRSSEVIAAELTHVVMLLGEGGGGLDDRSSFFSSPVASCDVG